MTRKSVDKGSEAEEAIRHAFLERGYFVVRGLPYRFGEYDVTDVDLLLYGTTGSSRELINVDVKNKKTPQAMERIFWAMGMRTALRCDRCIVATSETNPAVAEFGRRLGVTVLDGTFLRGAIGSIPPDRLFEESFLDALRAKDAEDLAKILRERYLAAKARFSSIWAFDSNNANLRDVGSCLEDLLMYQACRPNVRRVLYAISAFLCATLDAQQSRFALVGGADLATAMDQGLRYGSAGRKRIDDFIGTLGKCRFADASDGMVIGKIERQLESSISHMRTEIVVDFVKRNAPCLFALARTFEAAAFSKAPPNISSLDQQARSFIFMLADYFSLDRVKVGAC